MGPTISKISEHHLLFMILLFSVGSKLRKNVNKKTMLLKLRSRRVVRGELAPLYPRLFVV